ncbi:MAG: hypothetical protein U9N51_11975 [Bacteroidota bacterium]|nr:hypothetical protein [Bacteroidota bacterium]
MSEGIQPLTSGLWSLAVQVPSVSPMVIYVEAPWASLLYNPTLYSDNGKSKFIFFGLS